MRALTINAGSSSLKYSAFEGGELIHKGLVERIGCGGAECHAEALEKALSELLGKGVTGFDAVAHRVVHGGEKFRESALVDAEVLKAIQECIPLAPLHNPANLECLKACLKRLPEAKHVAVFDTAFHSTLEKEAFLYAIPKKFYEEYGVRRYGFHGTNVKWCVSRAAELLGGLPEKTVVLHLGNGASITAVKNGESVDTSMGFTPLEGLVMGTRSGDVDPSIIPFICGAEGVNAREAEKTLNKESGLKALCGSNDLRDAWKAVDEGSSEALAGLKVYARRATKYVGAYAAAMNGLDCIVFTGGGGEKDSRLRKMICEPLSFLGVELDEEKNEASQNLVSRGRVKVLVIPANEELQMVREAEALL